MDVLIPRGCTCIHEFTINGIPPASMVKKIRVIYNQNKKNVLTLTEDSAKVSDEFPGIVAGLSQRDTLLFSETEPVEVQIRMLLYSDKAIKTTINTGSVDRSLSEEVII